jgi:hypothetical protein
VNTAAEGKSGGRESLSRRTFIASWVSGRGQPTANQHPVMFSGDIVFHVTFVSCGDMKDDGLDHISGEAKMHRKSHPLVRKHEEEAKDLLKREMWRQGLTYRKLSQLLTDQGLPHTPENLANKIRRGGFSAGFMLQCFDALGVTSLTIAPSQAKPPAA